MLSFKDFLHESGFVNNPRATQVATTGGTYRKTGDFLKNLLRPNSKVISIGAGLDQTKTNLLSGLNGEDGNHEVHDQEPFPEGRKTPPEYKNAHEIPSDSYDAAVSHNVLNVVPRDVRDTILHHFFRSLKEGGHGVIGVRGWKGDVANAKNQIPDKEESNAIWIPKQRKNPDTGRSETIHSFQKGFDGNELMDYVNDFAKANGHEIEIKKIPGLAKSSIHFVLKKKGHIPQ